MIWWAVSSATECRHAPTEIVAVALSLVWVGRRASPADKGPDNNYALASLFYNTHIFFCPFFLDTFRMTKR